MLCAKTKWGPRPWRDWLDLAFSELVGLVCTVLGCWQMVWISTEKRPGKARRTKSERGFLDSYKEAPWRGGGGGGVAFVLIDKKKEGVRVCKGICRRGVKADGETARAEDSICVEAGGRGFNMIRAAWTEDRLSLCSWLGSTSLRPRRRWRKKELKIWCLCCLTNCLICTTLCDFHPKDIWILNISAAFPKFSVILVEVKWKKKVLWWNYTVVSQSTAAMNPVLRTFLSREVSRFILNIAVC